MSISDKSRKGVNLTTRNLPDLPGASGPAVARERGGSGERKKRVKIRVSVII